MFTLGYEYLTPEQKPAGWAAAVKKAAAYVQHQVDLAASQANVRLERINTARLQYKFPRALEALPVELRPVVEMLQARVLELCGSTAFRMQDCYALYTPADEVLQEARNPQNWHLDAVKRFPVAALLLQGARSTEFADGAYSDFASGVSEATLERW